MVAAPAEPGQAGGDASACTSAAPPSSSTLPPLAGGSDEWDAAATDLHRSHSEFWASVLGNDAAAAAAQQQGAGAGGSEAPLGRRRARAVAHYTFFDSDDSDDSDERDSHDENARKVEDDATFSPDYEQVGSADVFADCCIA